MKPMSKLKSTCEEVTVHAPELAGCELDRRFLSALENDEIEGDILTIDEHGQEVKNAAPHVTIFDVE